jgi:hypothetical protein
MGATMFLQQKMTPVSGDPTQAKNHALDAGHLHIHVSEFPIRACHLLVI